MSRGSCRPPSGPDAQCQADVVGDVAGIPPTDDPPPGDWRNFSGGIFGGTLWLLILAGLVDDWGAVGAVLGGDALILLGVVVLGARKPGWYWSIALLTTGALLALTLTVVNWRWTTWMRVYRDSAAYDPRNDVSLPVINLIVLGAFLGLFVLFALRYLRSRPKQKGRPPDGQD
jgi:hypothetical protein